MNGCEGMHSWVCVFLSVHRGCVLRVWSFICFFLLFGIYGLGRFSCLLLCIVGLSEALLSE